MWGCARAIASLILPGLLWSSLEPESESAECQVDSLALEGDSHIAETVSMKSW